MDNRDIKRLSLLTTIAAMALVVTLSSFDLIAGIKMAFAEDVDDGSNDNSQSIS